MVQISFILFILIFFSICQSRPEWADGPCLCMEQDQKLYVVCFELPTTNLTYFKSFRDARKIVALNIQCDKDSVEQTPTKLRNLKNLKKVEINGCKLSHLPTNFFGTLKKLETVIIKNSGLKAFPATILKKQKKLKTLDLSGNKLVSEPLGLDEMKNLMHLDLSGNSIKSITNIMNASNTLQFLNLSCNQLENELEFQKLPKSLTNLDLSHNKIQQIIISGESGKKLTRLNLSGNNITVVATNNSINELSKLQYLDLSFNEIQTVEEGAFRKLSQILKVDLRSNFIHEAPERALEADSSFRYNLYMAENPLKCSCLNYWMIFHHQSESSPLIADISTTTCSHVLDDSRKLSLLETERMNDFYCKDDRKCHDECLCCQQSRRVFCNLYPKCPQFILSSCGECWERDGINESKPHLVFTSTSIILMEIVPHDVTDLRLVSSLEKENGLGKMGRKEHLKLLNLSMSSIDGLSNTLVNQFPKVSTLDLSSLKLRNIFKDDLKAFPSLKILFLHFNELEEPNNGTLELFNSLEEISLRGLNTNFSCECGENETAFQKWLRSNKEKVIDLHQVTCKSKIHGDVFINKIDSSQNNSICQRPTTIPSVFSNKNINL